MADNKNFILAIALSMAILIGWNVFFGVPQMKEQGDGRIVASTRFAGPMERRGCESIGATPNLYERHDIACTSPGLVDEPFET